MSIARRILLVAVGVALLQSVVYYAQLPDTIASHFDRFGRPDGWQSKTGFFAVCLGTVLFLALSFMGLPAMIRRLPESWISMPHREYWLDARRREETLAYISDKLAWFGVASCVFMIGIVQLVVHANLREHVRLSHGTAWLVGAYLVLSIAWSTGFVIKFLRPPATAGRPSSQMR